MNEKMTDWQVVVTAHRSRNRELKAELRTILSALRELRELTKASTPHTTETGSPHFELFKLPKDGAFRTRGIAILERVDRILGKVEPEKEGGSA